MYRRALSTSCTCVTYLLDLKQDGEGSSAAGPGKMSSRVCVNAWARPFPPSARAVSPSAPRRNWLASFRRENTRGRGAASVRRDPAIGNPRFNKRFREPNQGLTRRIWSREDRSTKLKNTDERTRRTVRVRFRISAPQKIRINVLQGDGSLMNRKTRAKRCPRTERRLRGWPPLLNVHGPHARKTEVHFARSPTGEESSLVCGPSSGI
jgi:hypothetical protein